VPNEALQPTGPRFRLPRVEGPARGPAADLYRLPARRGVLSCNGLALNMRVTSASQLPLLEDEPMRMLSLISTLVVVGNTAATAWDADLTKIDRTIAKEPAYESKPQYCLLVFGPEAKTRVWLVRDGDVLYVDRNGNGDLTEDGERVISTGSPDPVFEAGDIAEAGGRVKHTQLLLQFHDNDQGGIWTSLQVLIEGRVHRRRARGSNRFASPTTPKTPQWSTSTVP
jgi:hypothetical protein